MAKLVFLAALAALCLPFSAWSGATVIGPASNISVTPTSLPAGSSNTTAYKPFADREMYVPCPPTPFLVGLVLISFALSGSGKRRIDSKSSHARRLYETTAKGIGTLRSAKASRIKGLWREFVAFLLS